MPVTGTGLRLIEEVNALLKYQLVGFVQGVSKLWSGRLARPGGFRGVDFVLQDYEGTVGDALDETRAARKREQICSGALHALLPDGLAGELFGAVLPLDALEHLGELALACVL